MESPDSDPIVAEIPVYLSKSLEGLLHVFSFPLRSSSRPYETANVELDVSEVNPSSTSASDNANDPRLAGLVDPAAAAAAEKAKNNNQRAQNVFGSSFEAGSNAALPSSSRHPNADQVVVGVRPKFTLHMSFDTSGPTADSFSGRDPVVDARNNNKKYVTTGHVSTLADDQPFGDLIQQSQPLTDDAASSSQFGAGGSNTNNQSGGTNAYYYRLESTPAPQHASYACALFYRNALHLTPITGLHQFFPKPLIDKNLELTLDSQQQQGSGGGAGQQQGGGGGQQQMSVAPTYQPRVLPRSIAIAKATERTRRIDFLSSDHCDTVPVAQRLIASSALQYQHSSSDRAGSTSSTSSVSDKNKNSNNAKKTMPPLPANAVEASRTAGAMARSSSDPLRDEEEMMWGLQAFFPFIDSAPEHEQLNMGRGGVGARQGGLQFLQQALASGKSNIALKFAHHAMGIDEQVSAVVTGGKLATCEDLQRHVSTPSSSSGGGGGSGHHHHHRSNSKERAGSTSSNSSSGSSSSISANSVPVVRLVQALRRVSVCVHGVWASLWDPTCSGIGAFVREFLLYCFAVESDKNDASISAREIFDLCGLNQQEQQHENISTSQLRKTIRSILPILADLDPKTKRWSLKNYCGGKHALALLNNSSEEVRKEVTDQYNGWVKRKELVLSNMRLLAQGEQVPRVNLALRAVAAAGMAALKGQQLSGGTNNNTTSSSSSLQQQRQEMIQNEELSRCRRFIRNSFELHGVINKGLFRERILSMQKEKQSIIFAVQKESLQNALREELRGFTDSTWILKNPVDPLTASLRPYFIEAIVKKKTFTTREIEQLAFQLIVDDSQQTVLKDPQSSVIVSQQQQQKQSSSATDDNSATNDNSDAAATATSTTKKHINISSEHHQMAVRLINELATFHRAEKIWHIKNGIVTFLSIQ